MTLRWLQETAPNKALSMKLDHLISHLMLLALKASIETYHVNCSSSPPPLRQSELIMGLQLGYMLLERCASKVQARGHIITFYETSERAISILTLGASPDLRQLASLNLIPSILLLDIYTQYEMDYTASAQSALE